MKPAVRFGLIGGLVLGLIKAIAFHLTPVPDVSALGEGAGMGQTMLIGIGQWILVTAVFFAMIYLGIKALREANGGQLSFGQGFGQGVIQALVMGVVVGIVMYIGAKTISHDKVLAMQDAMTSTMDMATADMDEDGERMMGKMGGFMKMAATPAAMAFGGFFSMILGGTILSLIVAAMLQRTIYPPSTGMGGQSPALNPTYGA